MHSNFEMAIVIVTALVLGLACAPKRAFTLLLVLDVVLVILVEAFASSRFFHSFGDSLFRLTVAALVASCLSYAFIALLLYAFRAANSADLASSGGPEAQDSDDAKGAVSGTLGKHQVAMLFHLAGLSVFFIPFSNLLLAFGFWIWKRNADPFTAYHVAAMLIFHSVYMSGLIITFFTFPLLGVVWFFVGLALIFRAAYLAFRAQQSSYPGVEKVMGFISKRFATTP